MKDGKSGCKGKDLGTLCRTEGFSVVSTTCSVVVSATAGTAGAAAGTAAGAAAGDGRDGGAPP